MKEETVRSVLRLVGVLIAVVGVITTISAIFVWLALDGVLDDQASERGIRRTAASEMTGVYFVLASATVIGLGLLLFRMSPWLARKIDE